MRLLAIIAALLLASFSAAFNLENLTQNRLGGTLECSGGSVNVDGGTLYVDCTNNRIGVGTTAPASKLDVSGDSTIRGQVTVTSTVTVQGNAFSVGTSTLAVANGSVGVGTQNPASKLHLSSGTLSIDGDASNPVDIRSTNNATVALSFANTNSGASAAVELDLRNDNLTNQGLRLHVQGTGVADSAPFFQDAGTLAADTNLSGGLGLAARNSSGNVRFYSGGDTERMRLDSGGNLGVGTANPSSKLHLSSGTLLIDGYPAAITVGVSTFVVTQGQMGIGTANPATKLHLSSGTLTIDGDAQTGLISSRPVVLGVRSGPSAVLLVQSTGTAATDRIFEVRNDGGSPQWAIMNSGDFAFMANPGIIRSNTANGSDNQNLSLAAGGAEGDSGRGAFMEFYGNEIGGTPGDSIWSAGNVAGGNLDMRTGGAIRIFVAEGGNIGIPTTSPASLVHASSGALIIDGSGGAFNLNSQASSATFVVNIASQAVSTTLFGVTGDGQAVRGCITAANLRLLTPKAHTTTMISSAWNCDDFDLYGSTGAAQNQWRNTRTGSGP